jgi:hypothetical protein
MIETYFVNGRISNRKVWYVTDNYGEELRLMEGIDAGWSSTLPTSHLHKTMATMLKVVQQENAQLKNQIEHLEMILEKQVSQLTLENLELTRALVDMKSKKEKNA